MGVSKRILLAVVVFVAGALLLAYQLDKWPFEAKWIQIVTSEGEPILSAALMLRRPGLEPDFSGTSDGLGWLKIPRSKIHDGAEMLVTAPGCAAVSGSLPSGARIELPQGLPVTFKIPGDFLLPRPPHHLQLRIEPGDEADPMWSVALAKAVTPHAYREQAWEEQDRRLLVDPDTRSVSLRLPRRGLWKIGWSIMRYETRVANGRHEISGLGQGPAGTDHVIEVQEAGEIPLTIASRALMKYMADAGD